MIRLKLGVVIASLGDEGVLEPALAAQKVWESNGWGDVWITSGIDGNHRMGSSHYSGHAIDLRLPPDPDLAVIGLRGFLPNWKVILETTHIHVQRV